MLTGQSMLSVHVMHHIDSPELCIEHRMLANNWAIGTDMIYNIILGANTYFTVQVLFWEKTIFNIFLSI